MFKYTDEQKAAWKKKYGEIFEIEAGDKRCIVHKPSRQELSYATAGSSQGKDAIKFSELLLKQVWVDGDREIMENDDYFLGVMQVLGNLAEVKQAEIKKL